MRLKKITRITKEDLAKIIKEESLKLLKEQAQEGEPTIENVHPLIDGMYMGNGVTPSTLENAPSAMGVMQNNPDNEHFKLALGIVNQEVFIGQGHTLNYFPFGFDDELIRELAKAGLPPEEVSLLNMEFGSQDNEYQVPYADW